MACLVFSLVCGNDAGAPRTDLGQGFAATSSLERRWRECSGLIRVAARDCWTDAGAPRTDPGQGFAATTSVRRRWRECGGLLRVAARDARARPARRQLPVAQHKLDPILEAFLTQLYFDGEAVSAGRMMMAAVAF